ncbi:tetraacyldisaccharide 4'-kinase [Pseudoduganella sp. CY13W]|uniref:Tetraacyldisaccharide 4'-kinase n=1 Tax=Duganella qianjiadongensis TaxID=2692176 RepID=A0ABW9VKJ3_9BURK|nr:tetraacyldisaccharide 4'-kinase [Duganella qianjiadongensis]
MQSGSALEARLTRAWLRRGPLACALWPVSLLFRALSGMRTALFRAGLLKSTRLPVPVVVVGNIFIGGTGKTPLTIWLVQALQAAGLRPAVISRGHGSKDTAPRLVDGRATAAQVGDEPLLIWQRCACPVMVGRDRAATGQALLALHPEIDILLTDDGLQHYALQRDVEIILFDGRGAGNGWLLPAGPLREPVSRRRDVTVINAAQLTPALLASVGVSQAGVQQSTGQRGIALPEVAYQMLLAGDYAEQLCNRQQRTTLAELAAQPALRVVAAAGIGNPARFFGMLRAAGLQVQELPLPDHHDFLDRPFAALQADLILMTEKDAVKCAQIEELRDDPRLWVVPVTARIDAALAAQIVEKCRGRSFA